MTPAERLVWVTHFLEEDLNKKDSSRAFSETTILIKLADKWDAPDIAAQVYTGQGNYLMNILHDQKGARNIYAQGVDFANAHDLEVPAASMLLQIGISYLKEDQPALAYEYYFRAHDIFARVGFDNVANIDEYEYEIGHFLYDLDDYKTAISHLRIAEEFPKSGAEVHYNVLAVMSWCYEKIDRPDNALDYLQKRLQLAQQENDSTWIGESYVDIGEHHVQEGCYPEARIYLSTGERLCAAAGHLQTAAWALILLSKVNMQEGNVYAAAEKLTQAETYLKQAGVKDWYPDLYRGWVLIYEQSGDFREAYHHQQLYEHSSDSARQITEVRTYANIQIRLEGRRHLMQMVQREQAAQTDGVIIILSLCLFMLLGGGAYFGWNYQQRRQKALIVAKQQVEQKLEQVLLEQQVAEHQKQMPVEEVKPLSLPLLTPLLRLGMPAADDTPPSTFSASLPPDPEAEQHAKEALEKILKLTLLTEDDSKDFRIYFEKVHPGFLAQLRARFPDLTQSETRLLALTKLNLKTKEMSEILNVEPNSIRRLRNRIRQKYNLPAGDNLENLLTKG